MRAPFRLSLIGLLGALPVLASLPCAAPAAAQTASPSKVRDSLKRVFGTGARADSLLVEGETVLRVSRGDSLLGFALVENVRGKDQPITCLIATDSALHLRDVDILVYREPYGGEVAYEAWRRQFRGRGPDDSLAVGREIRGISGATISVNAVTAGVRRTLADLARWRQAGKL